MMNKIKFLILLPAILAALSACGSKDGPSDSPSQESSAGSTQPSVSAPQLPVSETPPPNIVVEDDSQPPREGMVRSRLTNEWVDAGVAATRPIAVVIPHEINALPHYSLSEASILYEANVEYRMTRMMAVYEDWQSLDKIGNVRSLRTYYAYWAFEWDAFLVHLGGPFFIDDLIAQPTTENIDGILGTDDPAFFRSTDRNAPHNAYATGAGLKRIIGDKGYSLNYRNMADTPHFQFSSKLHPNTLDQYDSSAKSAVYIDMSGCYPLTRCYFEYNEDDGLYYRSQYLSGGTDGPHIDEATGEQLTFKNILVQYISYEDLGEGYLALQCQDTAKAGWFFTNGKGIPVTWEKTSDYGATKFYDEYGNEITLNTGKTMICVVQEDDSFTFR